MSHFNFRFSNKITCLHLRSVYLQQQLPYLISFLSFHNYSIYQILSPKHFDELLDSEHLYQSAKRFDLAIDGLQDAFIKDKVIDIMNMFANHHDVNYTLNNTSKCRMFSRDIRSITTYNRNT